MDFIVVPAIALNLNKNRHLQHLPTADKVESVMAMVLVREVTVPMSASQHRGRSAVSTRRESSPALGGSQHAPTHVGLAVVHPWSPVAVVVSLGDENSGRSDECLSAPQDARAQKLSLMELSLRDSAIESIRD